MSAEIINLRQARKRRARAENEAGAAANRARYGRTKAERAADERASDVHKRIVDGAERAGRTDKPDDNGG